MTAKSVYAEAKEIGAQKVNGVLRTVDSGFGAHWVESRNVVAEKLGFMLRDKASDVINFNWTGLRHIATAVSATFTATMTALGAYNLLNASPADILLYFRLRYDAGMFIPTLYSSVHSFFLDPYTMVTVLNLGAGIASVADGITYLGFAAPAFLLTPVVYYSNRILSGAAVGTVKLVDAVINAPATIRNTSKKFESFLRTAGHLLRSEQAKRAGQAVGIAVTGVLGSVLWDKGGAFLLGGSAGWVMDTFLSVAEVYRRKE